VTANVSVVDPLGRFDQWLGWPVCHNARSIGRMQRVAGRLASRCVSERWELSTSSGKRSAPTVHAQVDLASSNDGGATFSPPATVSDGDRGGDCFELQGSSSRGKEFSSLVIDKKGNMRVPWEHGGD